MIDPTRPFAHVSDERLYFLATNAHLCHIDTEKALLAELDERTRPKGEPNERHTTYSGT